MQTVIPVRPAVFENENRIAVFIPNQIDIKNLIKQVPNSRWSPSLACWHFLKTVENWQLFQRLFQDFDLNIQKNMPPLSIPKSDMLERPKLKLKADEAIERVIQNPPFNELSANVRETLKVPPTSSPRILPSVQKPVFVEKTPFKIEKVSFDEKTFIAVPITFDDAESQRFIKTIKGRLWHIEEKFWVVPYDTETLHKLKEAFGDKLQFPTSREARPIESPLTEPKIPLKPQYQNKENNPLWDELKRKQEWATAHPIKDDATAQSAIQNPQSKIEASLQETAKQRFTPVSLEELLAQHNGTEPILQKTLQVKDKITVRLAQFWQGYLRLDCYYRQDWVNKLKQINGNRWHKEHNCWTLPHSPLVISILDKMFGDTLEYDLSPITEAQVTSRSKSEIRNSKPKTQNSKPETAPQYQDEVTRMEGQMTLKRMSFYTIKLYKSCFTQFLHYYNDKHPQDITKEEIIKYMLHRIKDDKISPTVQNSFISAIKCYYEFVLGRERTYYDLQRPKMPFQLPKFLSQDEVIKLFQAIDNIKHRCILFAIYSSGLRLSEVVNLRIADIRRDDKSIFVKAGKGKKDRYTMLSEKLVTYLDIYLKQYSPSYWLFEGQTGGQYSVKSVQNILRAAVEKSGVNPYATVHSLRHSFATHLTYCGIDTISLQHLLGHASPVTTEIYVHLSQQHLKQIQSPLDKLNF